MHLNDVSPPWTAALTDSEHTLLLYAIVAAALALLATQLRLRFAPQEVQGAYRTASLTANAVVAIAFASYVLLLGAAAAGYHRTGGAWIPSEIAPLVWWLRYADWTITVPLLVVELLAVSSVSTSRRATQIRAVSMTAAFAMIVFGFLGAVIVDEGRSFSTLLLFGLLGSLCFLVLGALIVGVVVRSLPRLPPQARNSYRGATLVLVTVWFVYPIVYGLQGVTTGGAWAVTGAVALSVADLIAKIGFGTLIHRTAVLRSRADEDASPTTTRRPRQPEADSLWVENQARFDSDPDLHRDSSS